MKKIVFTAVAAMGFALLLLTGCTQIVATSASTQQAAVSAQSTVVSAAPSQATVQPTATPSVSAEPSQSPSASASVSANASASPSASAAYKVAVPYDLEQERNSQKSVDNGHSPWRMDAISVVQTFVSVQMEPGGVVGDFPIQEEDLRVTQMSNSDAVVEVINDKSPTSKVYLKRLVRQEDGGIWTVVGYDPK
ncbi:MAG: hypothetical protein WCP73_00060 [Eubacteriales bacterium]